MIKGDTVQVRPKGAGDWVSCLVDLVSPNQQSIIVSAEEGLPTDEGFGFDVTNGRMLLLLFRDNKGYHDIFTSRLYEIQEGVDHASN